MPLQPVPCPGPCQSTSSRATTSATSVAGRSPWSSPTGSAATRTCGAWWRPRSRTTTGSSCSTMPGTEARTARRTTRAAIGRLDGFAQDLLDVVSELDLRDVVVVAHSVSSMIARARHHPRAGALFAAGDDRSVAALHQRGEYRGGFEEADIRRPARHDGQELRRLGGRIGADGDHRTSIGRT